MLETKSDKKPKTLMQKVKYWALMFALFWVIKGLFTIFLPDSNTIDVENLSQAQIKQIEEIAAAIAQQVNAKKGLALDATTTLLKGSSSGRTVFYYYNITNTEPVFLNALKADVSAQVCKLNADNEAFFRGLNYTYIYMNQSSQEALRFTVDLASCKAQKNI